MAKKNNSVARAKRYAEKAQASLQIALIRERASKEIAAVKAAMQENLKRIDAGEETVVAVLSAPAPAAPAEAPGRSPVPQPAPVAPVERVPLQPPSDGFVDPPPGDSDFVRIVPTRTPRGPTMISGINDPPPDMSQMVMVAPATRDFPATYMPR
jgi:hypothetical protein